MEVKHYEGYVPNHNVTVTSGAQQTKALAHHVRHSPTGFSWGYNGSGPAELARCLLIEEFPGYEPSAMLYQQFKQHFVGRWPQEKPWLLSSVEIRQFVGSFAEANGEHTLWERVPDMMAMDDEKAPDPADVDEPTQADMPAAEELKADIDRDVDDPTITQDPDPPQGTDVGQAPA